jgi:hypothetical protein
MHRDEEKLAQGAWLEWLGRHRVPVSVTAHLVLFACAWFLAFGLAYNFKQSPTLSRPLLWIKSLFIEVPPFEPGVFDWLTDFCLPLLVPVLAIKLTVFVLFGLHRAAWRYVSLRDVFAIARGAWWSFFGIFILYFGLQNASSLGLPIQPFGEKFPDSVFVQDFAGRSRWSAAGGWRCGCITRRCGRPRRA